MNVMDNDMMHRGMMGLRDRIRQTLCKVCCEDNRYDITPEWCQLSGFCLLNDEALVAILAAFREYVEKFEVENPFHPTYNDWGNVSQKAFADGVAAHKSAIKEGL